MAIDDFISPGLKRAGNVTCLRNTLFSKLIHLPKRKTSEGGIFNVLLLQVVLKSFLFAPLLLLAFCGCKKTSVLPDTPPLYAPQFVLYKIVDTNYSSEAQSAASYNLTEETLSGDTIYLATGSSASKIVTTPIIDSSLFASLGDTLNFTSPTTGFESDATGKNAFTYSVKTQLFYNGAIGRTATLTSQGNSGLELLEVEMSGGKVADATAFYYKEAN